VYVAAADGAETVGAETGAKCNESVENFAKLWTVRLAEGCLVSRWLRPGMVREGRGYFLASSDLPSPIFMRFKASNSPP
jgi:hypothetical protein